MQTSPAILHIHERQELANRLHVSLEQFDALVSSANKAYDVISNLGPFYGREDIKEPTFRITAQPVLLPKSAKQQLEDFGNNVLNLAKALQKLPQQYKLLLGEDLDYSIPPTWRIDAIINEKGKLLVNEIEGRDGAAALMMAEQFAYQLQTVNDSTAAKFIPTLKKICNASTNPIHIAYFRTQNAHSTDVNRFIDFIEELSNNTIRLDHIYENEVSEGHVIDWSAYAGVINESAYTPKEMLAMGVRKDQIISSGNFHTLVNKGVFALVFEPKLQEFWKKELGKDRFEQLQEILIPTYFIKDKKNITNARNENKVVKVSWAGTDTALVNRSRGVALPEGDIEQSSRERWQLLEELLKNNATIVAQEYVRPKKVSAFLRKKMTNLEPVEWYNRVCVKYVCEDDPKADELPNVALTATEVTLGPDVIPAGRKCAFTAGKFS